MNKGKLIGMCVLCVLMAGSSATLAQGGRPAGPPRGGPERGGPPALPDSTQIVQIVDQLAEELSLSADQKEQISELHFAHFREVRTLMSAGRGNRDGIREKMEALREEFESNVKALLDEEQQAKFDKLQKNRGQRSGRQGRRR